MELENDDISMKVCMVSKIDESVGGMASYTKVLAESLQLNSVNVENANIKEVFRINADLIHIQHEPLLYGLILSILFPIFLILIRLFKRKPIIITLHGIIKKEDIKDFAKENDVKYPLILIKWMINFIFKYIVKFADLVIVHADCFRDWLVLQYGSDDSKIKVVPHGIWIQNRIQMEHAKQILGYPGKKVAFTMGYLAKHKGLDELVEIFSKVEYMNTILIIGGSIPPRFKDNPTYKIYLNKLKQKAPENVKFKGFIPYKLLPTYFSATDLFIIPHKRRASASGPLCRAIGYGLPIIAYKNEVFRDYLPEFCLVNDLEKSIMQFLTHENILTNAISWSESFAKSFSWERIAILTKKIYMEIFQ
ncbi:MAG: glycosyltransferase family 4 protein [Candidatus Thorarchaeota archaeon]